MADCASTNVSVLFYVDVEMDDQSSVSRFGPMSTQAIAESLLLAVSGRTDVKKATLIMKQGTLALEPA